MLFSSFYFLRSFNYLGDSRYLLTLKYHCSLLQQVNNDGVPLFTLWPTL